MSSNSYKFPDRKTETPKRRSPFSKKFLADFLKTLKDKKPEEILFREVIAARTLPKNMEESEKLFTKRIPLGVVADPEILLKITDKMTIAQKTAMFKKAIIDVTKYKMVNLNKITHAKKDLIREGNAINTSPRGGYMLFSKKK